MTRASRERLHIAHQKSNSIGRPVRIVSIGFASGKSLEQICDVVGEEGARGADLIALPETWLGQENHDPERLTGSTISVVAALAAKHHTYVVCPIDRWDGQNRLNSSVLLHRSRREIGKLRGWRFVGKAL